MAVMSVKRDGEVPATERVEFVRVGMLIQVDRTQNEAFLRLEPDGGALSGRGDGRRLMASSDAAGDHMRVSILTARKAADGSLVTKGDVPATWVRGDWLWVEV